MIPSPFSFCRQRQSTAYLEPVARDYGIQLVDDNEQCAALPNYIRRESYLPPRHAGVYCGRRDRVNE